MDAPECTKEGCNYTGRTWNGGLCDLCCEDYLNSETGRYFTIGQIYEDGPAEEVECARCGARKFSVARAHYYTALRCDECEWEYCIHEG